VLELANRHFVPKGVLALASNTAAMLSSIPTRRRGPARLSHDHLRAMIAPPSVALVRQAIEPALRGPGGRSDRTGTCAWRSCAAPTPRAPATPTRCLTELRRADAPGGREEVRQFMVEDDAMTDPALFAGRVAAEVAAFAPHVVLDGGAPREILAHTSSERGPRTRGRSTSTAASTSPPAARSSWPAPDFSRPLPHDLDPRQPDRTPRCGALHGRLRRQTPPPSPRPPTTPSTCWPTPPSPSATSPITGRSLAAAIRRLQPPGEPLEVGPAGIYPALKTLGRGGNIDLRGTLTTLDFDPETGDATADFTMSCLAASGELINTAARYDATTRTFTNLSPCS
jgi:hypothetical protein